MPSFGQLDHLQPDAVLGRISGLRLPSLSFTLRYSLLQNDHTHHAVHNVPLARLVFVPKDDGRLHRRAIDAIEAGKGIAGGGVVAEGEHRQVSVADSAREAAT